jgi:hypothetical protein
MLNYSNCCLLKYSLLVYFGYLIREGAFQLRGLELDLKTYKFSLCLTFTFTNQCQSPRKNRVRNVKKSVLGQKCQRRLILIEMLNYNCLLKYRHLRKPSDLKSICGIFIYFSSLIIAPYHEETILDYCF